MTSVKGGGRPPQIPQTPLQSAEGKEAFAKEAAAQQVPQKVVDGFVRASPVLNQQLMALASKVTAKSLNFSSQALAQLAGMFAAVLQQHPGADRKTRAKLFAKMILKNRKFGKIFDGADEEDLEKMFDTIAAQLDASPVLAQMIDDVTEATKRIKLSDLK